MTDSELLASAVAGRIDAFDRLLGRYFDEGARFAYRMLGNHADAEDALQEACLKAFQALRSYREQDAFRGWFFRIVANQCRDAARRRRRRDARFVADEARLAAEGRPPEQPALAAGDALQRALDGLEPLLREAIVLKHGEGMDYAEMTVVTGASVSALKMRVKRACAALRPLLEGWHDD